MLGQTPTPQLDINSETFNNLADRIDVLVALLRQDGCSEFIGFVAIATEDSLVGRLDPKVGRPFEH